MLETAKGALDAGFDVILLSGAHSTYDTDAKSASEIERDVEKELRQRGAQMIHFTDYLDELA